MTEVKHTEEKTLKELLDGLLLSQRKDIHAYSGGHLNEANLWKPSEKVSHRSWKSAKKDSLTLVPKSKFSQTRSNNREKDAMAETLVSFSIGTAGIVPLPPLSRKDDVTKGSHTPRKCRTKTSDSLSAKSTDSKDSYSKMDDGILIEELKLPEIMLKDTQHENSRDPTVENETSKGRLANKAKFESKRQFLSGFQEAVTKQEQFTKMKAFETDILRLQDAKEKHVLTGIKAVVNLEAKLKADFLTLINEEKSSLNAVNFKRLQVYSQSFGDLILSTTTFAYVLGQIKREYDDYISYLLDIQPNKHHMLQDQMQQMSARGSSNARILRFESERVLEMEEQTKDLLDENERLRRELQEELELSVEAKEEERKVKLPALVERPPLDLVDQIEELHATILEKLDKINDVRNTLRTDYVPTSVCTHLEQCIKETEVETQRLLSQKDYFEKNIAEMETELQQHIENADTTEKDAKRVWKRVHAVKAISSGGQVIFTQDSESETDEEAKWNWYIS